MTRLCLSWVGVGLFTLSLFGCGADPTLTLSNYRTNCSAPADCIAVSIGDICPCACPNAAINRADSDKYQADYAQAISGCSKVCQADCINVMTTCSMGTCATVH